MDIIRRKTRRIQVGEVPLGGDEPIVVQSMTNTPTDDVEATASQANELVEAGCELIRVAVPDEAAAEALPALKQRISAPIIADIHFDHRLALLAAERGADGLRINPGNLGGTDRLKKVIQKAAERGVAVRIGVNSGSLEKDLLAQKSRSLADRMVESALRQVTLLEDWGFSNYKISIKSSDVRTTLDAYRSLSEKTDAPLHLGVTEAGSVTEGTIKSSIGIGMLLAEGIGDTFRVSLTAPPIKEMRVAYGILRTLGIRERGIELVSCPTCGRCRVDLLSIVDEVEHRLAHVRTPLKVAVMGCVVNGPGEAREADVGVAGGKGIGILFKKGERVRKIEEADLVNTLVSEVESMVRDFDAGGP
jgi:(E)-4-hydroxy-3-methylbut-2-enyl-diphosphate synthase